MSRQYFSGAETAKLMRLALKESFPGVKFSVRSDYNSVNVRWTDGPNAKQVEAVADNFQGGYFDGMIDYAGSVYHKLDGKPVQFAKYVFCKREESPELIAAAIAYLKAKYPSQIGDECTVEAYEAGKLHSVYPTNGWSYEHSLQSMIWKAAAKRSTVAAPLPSATLARIQFQGDDGYGRGTVGLDGAGGEQCYKGMSEARERAAATDKAAAEAAAVSEKLVGAFEKGALVLITGGVQ
jgi:hypothetical protein